MLYTFFFKRCLFELLFSVRKPCYVIDMIVILFSLSTHFLLGYYYGRKPKVYKH